MNKRNTSHKLSQRRKLACAFGVILLLFAAAYAVNAWNVKHFNRDMQFDHTPDGLVSRFPLDIDCTLQSVSGFPVDFDMGSRHSFMSEKSLAKIRKEGYPVKEENTFIYTKDEKGIYHLYTRKVRLDLSLPNPELPDGKYYIRNAELLVNDESDHNVFGMDVLRNLVIERDYNTNELLIYSKLPADKGYAFVSDITIHDSFGGDLFGETGRASVSLKVNNDDRREYFFDTGGEMRHIELVQPRKRMASALTPVVHDSVIGHMVQHHCKVKFGDRLRYSTVVYSDDIHTDEYSVNPLMLFDSDVIFDFPGKQLLIKRPDSK